jgi:TrmH RNA methyltransferase
MKEDVIAGLNAVAALFARRPDDVRRLFYTQAMRGRVGEFCALLAATKRPYRLLEPEAMEKAAGTPHHGGIAAVARRKPFAILQFDTPPRVPLLLALDGVGNPHNLGAIARSAAFFGVRALLLHEAAGQAMPSDAAYRTAEGGLEFLDLYRTRDLPGAIRACAPFYRSVAASLSPHSALLGALPRDRPVLLVLGNEETGVSPAVVAACRREVRIPGSGQVQSLNVAQAAAVLLHTLSGLS